MKTGAIIRIVIWSLVALVLVGILVTALAANAFHFRVDFGGVSESTYAVSEDGTYQFDPDAIEDIQIEWVNGSITVIRGDVDEIVVSEPTQSKDDWKMVCSSSGNKLKVQYCPSGVQSFHFNFKEFDNKNLTITVPQDWDGGDLEISSVSASIQLLDQTLQQLRLENVSGDALFRGSVSRINCETVSGSLTVECDQLPNDIDFEAVSANLTMKIPEDNAGFAVELDSASGSFESDFNYRMEHGKYCFGDGKCDIDMDTVSGNLQIYKK